MSQREEDILKWYQTQPRQLSKSFVDSIPWKEVTKYELGKKFIPVLVYMRDVEAFTDIYYKELLRTPTGKDPVIRRFMDQWQHEEAQHAYLLDRFLNEAGFPTSNKWFDEAKAKIPAAYTKSSRRNTFITNLFGKKFSAVHMTWGAINELSTLQGYKRLWELAKHPVLEYVLKGIASEEAIHVSFYRNIAKIKLEESKFSRELARYIIEKFWTPVGQGTKPEKDTNYVIATLFSSDNGLETVDTNINRSIALLPGFEDCKKITNRIAEAVTAGTAATTQGAEA